MADATGPSQFGSVTLWLDQARRGDEQAASLLWQRYLDPVLREAARQFHGFPTRGVSADDVAQSVFLRLFIGARTGRFDHLTDREYLWATLLTIVRGKVVDAIRRETRDANFGGQALGESAVAPAGVDAVAGLGGVAGDEPTPLMLAVVREQHCRLNEALRDDTAREVARLRMEGCPRAEIAQRLEISLAKVDRKLAVVREAWERIRRQDEET